jgi:hypothetical protein
MAFAQSVTLGCLVTKPEHRRLPTVDQALWMRPNGFVPVVDPNKHPLGFERYAAAGVKVFDRETGEAVPLPPLPRS